MFPSSSKYLHLSSYIGTDNLSSPFFANILLSMAINPISYPFDDISEIIFCLFYAKLLILFVCFRHGEISNGYRELYTRMQCFVKDIHTFKF